MNLAVAGPLVCIWLSLRRRRGDLASGQVGRWLAGVSLAALVDGILVGLLLVGLAWLDSDPGYRDALSRFPARAYWNGLAELAFSVVCLAAYAFLWDRWALKPWWHATLAVLGSTNLLYHFPPLMSAIAELAARPELVPAEVVTRPLVLQLMSRPRSHVAGCSLQPGVAGCDWRDVDGNCRDVAGATRAAGG